MDFVLFLLEISVAIYYVTVKVVSISKMHVCPTLCLVLICDSNVHFFPQKNQLTVQRIEQELMSRMTNLGQHLTAQLVWEVNSGKSFNNIRVLEEVVTEDVEDIPQV